MPCTPFRTRDGMTGIICTSRRRPRCSVPGCNAPSGFQCDHRMKGGKTCDRHLCATHAHQVGDDVHFCPTHLAETGGERQRDLFA